MGEGLKQMFHEVSSPRADGDDELTGSSYSISSLSSDLSEDEVSSPHNLSHNSSSPTSHLDSNGPLHELSSLVEQLPIKRGLSKYYQGKSQSFSSLSDVKSAEDLPKKESPYRRKMKPCKSYAGGLDETHKSYYAAGPYNKTTPKKASRGSSSCASLVARSRSSSSSSFLCGGKPPQIPM